MDAARHLALNGLQLCARPLDYPPRPGRTPDVAAFALVVRALRGAVYEASDAEERENARRAAVALALRFVAVLAGVVRLAPDHRRKEAAILAFCLVSRAAAEAIETPGAQGMGRAWVALARFAGWVEEETAREGAPVRLPPVKRPRGPSRAR